MSSQKGKMISLGGLWLKEARDGSKFMVGNFGHDGKIFIFKNKAKKNQNSPDYFVMLAPNEQQTDNESAETQSDEPPF